MPDTRQSTIFRTQANTIYAVVSVTLVLVLIGFFGFSLLMGRKLVRLYQEKINIMVEMERETPEPEARQLKIILERAPFVKTGSVEYTTKEKAAELLKADFGEDFLQLDMPNPLFDVITFNVKAAYMNPDSLVSVIQGLKAKTIVRDVYYQESLVENIVQNVEKIAYIALSLGIIFIFVAVYLIHNTVKLALYANRFLIKNMELVGASWEFISRPYIIRSFWQGLMSAVLALLALIGMGMVLLASFPELKELAGKSDIVLLFMVLSLLGITISVASTWFVVSKYLQMRVDEMY